MQYLVTTDKSQVPSDKQIIMVDGTVPGWEPKPGDLHFDHHHPNGAPIQIAEIQTIPNINENVCFVTTQVDADACVAAAWIQLLQMSLDGAEQYDAYVALAAIAYDCDHLGLPADESWDPFREFAAKAVAALKESGNAIAVELGLPSSRKEWKEDQRSKYSSVCFQRGTEWLIDAVLGASRWPGESGEADSYFARLEEQRPLVYEKCRLYKGCAVFDQREFDQYIDPRLLVEWAGLNNVSESITLTIRDGSNHPNAKLLDGFREMYSYTLGSVPLHPKGSPKFSDRDVWKSLAALELTLRTECGNHPAATEWGGRNEVGGSGWRDPVISSPEQVLDVVLDCLSHAA